MTRQSEHFHEETVTAGLKTIGRIVGDPVRGFTAYDTDGRIVETFSTLSAARRALAEAHRSEVRP
jgi:hypothetical protein